jgi:hypothetical protein
VFAARHTPSPSARRSSSLTAGDAGTFERFMGAMPFARVAAPVMGRDFLGIRASSNERSPMSQCEVCGNDYDKSFDVTTAGSTHTFDSFECAIHRLAPTCEHCGCRVIGHGVESDGRIFCCANCAAQAGVGGLQDRVD